MTTGLIRRVFGVEALLASRSLAGSLRRTSVLVGALSTAIAVLTAVGIMVGAFAKRWWSGWTISCKRTSFSVPPFPPARTAIRRCRRKSRRC